MRNDKDKQLNRNEWDSWTKAFLLWLAFVAFALWLVFWIGFTTEAGARWKYNPYTRELDYYQDLADDSDVHVPQPYEEVDELLDIMKILAAAGIIEYPTTLGVTHEDRSGIAHADREGITHEDHLYYDW